MNRLAKAAESAIQFRIIASYKGPHVNTSPYTIFQRRLLCQMANIRMIPVFASSVGIHVGYGGGIVPPPFEGCPWHSVVILCGVWAPGCVPVISLNCISSWTRNIHRAKVLLLLESPGRKTGFKKTS